MLLYNAKKERVSFVDILTGIYIFVLIGNGLGSNYIYIEMVLFLVLFLSMIINKGINFIRDKHIIVPFLIYVGCVFLCGMLNDPLFYTAKQIGSLLITFSPLLIFSFYKNCTLARRKFILFFSIFSLVFFSALSLYFYLFRAVDARRIADRSRDYGNLIIGGGYSLAYGLVIFILFFVDLLKRKKIRKKYSFAILIGTIISCFTILKTGSTITLISLVMGLLIILVLPSAKTILGKISEFLFSSILILFVLLVFQKEIGLFFINISSELEGYVGIRIESLGHFFYDDFNNLYTIDRMSIPIDSFLNFIKNPIFGLCLHNGNQYYSVIRSGAGGHCEWIDCFTKYGIVGGIPYVYLFFSSLKKCYLKDGLLSLSLIIIMVIMGLFNPFVSNASAFIVLFLLPFFSCEKEPFYES